MRLLGSTAVPGRAVAVSSPSRRLPEGLSRKRRGKRAFEKPIHLKAQFGLRFMYASRKTFQTLIGETDWDAVALVEYPSRDHFFSMGGSSAFQVLHAGREAGLSQTYIICSWPAVVNTLLPTT